MLKRTFLGLCGLLAVAPRVGAEELVLSGATLIDGSGGPPRRNAVVRVVDGRIREVGLAAAGPGAGCIDLSGRYLLPGLIDAHAHIESPAAARRALLSGVTTARILGDTYLQGLGTRDLVKGGFTLGPELVVSGGHVRPTLGEAFFVTFPQFGRFLEGRLTGPDNVAAVVRALIAKGVDVIKVGASERAGLATTDPRRPELSYEELRAAVEEARQAGLFVAAHAHARRGANDAVRAGVRSIEHGTYLDDETLALMKERGTFFVPTLAIMSPLGDPHGDDANSIALQVRTHHMQGVVRDAVKRARALGIPIAAATDGSYGDGEDSARVRVADDIEALIGAGLTPMEAIVAATRTGARLLGIDSRTGRVAVGLEADLLVVDRDPLTDPTTLFEPMLVVNDGKVVLNRLD